MTEVGEDDFYIVLPSNSNPETHPNNNASKYIVSWENPINFGNARDWRVALTEMTYNFSPKTVTDSYGISFSREKRDVWTRKLSFHANKGRGPTIKMDTVDPPANFESITKNLTRVTFSTQGHLVLISDFAFRLIFKTEEQAKKCGFHDKVNVSATPSAYNYHTVVSDDPFFKTKDESIYVDDIDFIQESVTYQESGAYYFPKPVYWDNVGALIAAVRKRFRGIFDDVRLSNDRIEIQVNPLVKSIRFIGGLNFILGFSHVTHKNAILTGDFAPQLNRGLNNLYVYASICAPVQVGHSRVPLLRSIWINVSKNFHVDELRNVDIRHPMYMPINSASINNIEINIRTDSGALVPFSEGSVTSITLHFKRVKKS